MNEQPKHAIMPLWKDKNIEQKQKYLSELLLDLNHYINIKGLEAYEIDIPNDDKDCDGVKKQILEKYSQVLEKDIKKILHDLDLAIPYDEQELKDKERFIKEILENPNFLNKNCEIGHITGSALVIDAISKKVLLHKHKKLGIWLQFGGHADYELNPIEVAIRESREESGLPDLVPVTYLNDIDIPIDVEVQKINENFPKPEHIHADFRYLLFTNNSGKVFANEGESGSFIWISIPGALAQPDSLISTPVKRLIIKADKYFKSLVNEN